MIPLSPPSNGPTPPAALIQTSATMPTAIPNATIIMTQREPDPYIEPKVDSFNWIFATIATFVVSLRLYNRYRRQLPFWWDDYIALISATLLLGLVIVLTIETHIGAGRHMSTLDTDSIQHFLLSAEVSSTFSIVVTSLSKTGFAVTLLRDAVGGPRVWVWGLIFVMNVVSCLAATLLWVQCTPLRKNFETLKFGYCWPDAVRLAVPVVNSAVSAATDILISFLGLYIVHRKTMRQGYWVGALGCSMLGISGGIIGFAKSGIMHIIIGKDISFDIVPLILLGVAEPSLIITAASLPELRNYIWKHPKPVKYRYTGYTHEGRNELRVDVDYEYAHRQYANAGGKTYSYHSAMTKSTNPRPPNGWI